jgi:Cu(I)/Ag(I) efflux system membrane protein CusA/SilA
MLSTGIRTQVGIKVFGPDLGQLEKIAARVEAVVKNVPGAVDLYSEKIVGKPYVEIEIDREAIARYGAQIKDVQNVIQTAIGGMNLTHTIEGRERYPVRVRYHREYRNNIDGLKRVLVPTPSGAEIPLGQMTHIKKVMGPAMINSENGMLRAYVLLNVRGRDIIGFVEEASTAVAEQVKLPPGYNLSWSGKFENQVRARKKLSVLVPFSLLINFLILLFAFRSVSQTMIIFFAIPVSLAGGIFLLWFSGFSMSVAVWVGFIALFGIAVDAGVVLIAYLNQVFKDKDPQTKAGIYDCVVEAASMRIRPVIMTSLTTVVALLPVLISTGAGSEVMKPMAIPTVGGMSVLFLTLFIVPVCYAWVEERKRLK